MLMLELDDAVKTTKEIIKGYCDFYFLDDDEDYFRQELMQKCYFVNRDGSPEKDLADLIDDVNVVEIGDQIAHGKLSQWCISWRVAATTQLARSMRKWQTGEPDTPGIYEVTIAFSGENRRYVDYTYWDGGWERKTEWDAHLGIGYLSDVVDGVKVLAWREMSEPYQG